MEKRQTAVSESKPFQTVKETVRTTGLSEHFLRTGIKEGKVPVVQSGKKFFVNVPKLLERLNAVSQ